MSSAIGVGAAGRIICKMNLCVKSVPPWRRGQPKGQGMDPPRRGGSRVEEDVPSCPSIHSAALPRPFARGLQAWGQLHRLFKNYPMGTIMIEVHHEQFKADS